MIIRYMFILRMPPGQELIDVNNVINKRRNEKSTMFTTVSL